MGEIIKENAQSFTGVGTLNEKPLHAFLKNYVEPDTTRHEIKIGRYVVDIQNENGIFEVQTASFGQMTAKLRILLPSCKITVVYPVPQIKWLCWVSLETGEIGKRRKSTKKGQYYDVLFELYRIRPFLLHENFSLKVILLEVEEHRLADGWGNGGKRGSHRIVQLPLQILGEQNFNQDENYRQLIPESLPQEFTAKEYARATKRNGRFTSAALAVLQDLKVIQKSGQTGRAFLYKRLF